MSNIVEQINDALESTAATALAVDYQLLDHKYLVEKNNFSQNKDRYGARPLSATNSPFSVSTYSARHIFRLTLTTDFRSFQAGDSNKQTAAFGLYDSLDDIIVLALNSKLGLSSILSVEDFSIDELDVIEQSHVAILNTDFTIRYKRDLNNC